jgi:hypothetical protein
MLHQNPVRQAVQFALEHAAGAAQEMMDTLKRISKRSNLITKLVIGASIPHQIMFIVNEAVPYLDWSQKHWIDSIAMFFIAVAFPAGCDLLLLNCIETVSARAASAQSRIWALALMLLPTAGSCIVNFLAYGPLLIKLLAGGMVLLVPMSQSLKFIKADFKKMDDYETSIVASVTSEPEPTVSARKKRRRGPSKKAQILKLLADNPSMDAKELAGAAGCHINHAYTVVKEFQAQRDRELVLES